MSLSKRRDFGGRVAGDKGRLSDEFVTKRQIVQGTNITITHLDNFDIMISANTGGGGSGEDAFANGVELIRDLYVELKLVRPFFSNNYHYDLNDNSAYDNAARKYFGTHVFAEIRHNWNLPTPDSFQYSVLDSRTQASPNARNKVNSIPKVVGVNRNKIRIIGTDAVSGTRTNPYYWVNLTDNNTKMDNTRFLHFQSANPQNAGGELLGDYNAITPTYRIRITEVRDWEFGRLNIVSLDDFSHPNTGAL